MNNKDVLDILRRTYSDTAPDILVRLSFEGIEKEEAVVTPVRKRYAAAVAIYAAACLVVAILLPFFIGGDDPKPTPGVVPYNTETAATGDERNNTVETEAEPMPDDTEIIDEFMAALERAVDEGRISSGVYNKEYCVEVTPDDVFSETSARIFKFSDTYSSFIYVDCEAYTACYSYGGMGIGNAVTCDFDGNGMTDLLYSSSSGSGMLASSISIFNMDTKTKEDIDNRHSQKEVTVTKETDSLGEIKYYVRDATYYSQAVNGLLLVPVAGNEIYGYIEAVDGKPVFVEYEEPETTTPKETVSIIGDPIPVETSETKEPVTVSPDPVPVTTPKETEPPKHVTTPKETCPPKPIICYPAPAVSVRTLTSITKSLYGCEYTISVDKPGYRAGDIIKVTVTLENKGESTLAFSSGSGENYLKNIGFYEDNTVFHDTHTEGIDYPCVETEDDLTPGEKWETTREYCTCECDPFAEWTIKGAINFVFDGEAINESLELDVYHALPEEFSDGSPYSKLPKMTDFSSEVIEKRKNPFADIESAVLYRNGAAVPLAADDPMLVRLLNFMTYSDEETLLSAEVAGFYGKAVYEAAMASDYRLEIVFKNTYYNRNDECPNIHVFSSFDRVIITGDEVYLINDQEEPNYEHIGYIDEYQLICTGWLPYACHFSDEDVKFDILTYAGFSNYTGG